MARLEKQNLLEEDELFELEQIKRKFTKEYYELPKYSHNAQPKTTNDLLGRTGINLLEYVISRHKTLNMMYERLSQLVIVCIRKGLKLIIENPATQPHYLNRYWCIEPKLIDKDRSESGDFYKKPTQYWFIGFEPQHNFIFEPIKYVETKIISKVKGKDRQRERSMIHPQYARRFIKEHILTYEQLQNITNN